MDIKNLFEDNFGFEFKAVTYNNMKVAIQAFKQFKKKNENIFSFNKRETLFGHLRTYFIEKQFNDSAFNPKANYSVYLKEVNKCKYKALCIETNDFIVNLGRTENEYSLLPVSAYKKEFAKANAGLSMQLSFDFLNESAEIIEGKKYAEITYGYRCDDISHLKIVLPNSDYNMIEYSENLLEDIKIYENYIPEELVEESIVSLKESITKKIEKII